MLFTSSVLFLWLDYSSSTSPPYVCMWDIPSIEKMV